MNEIMAIKPYYDMGCWVFDDPRTDLEGEPLVGAVNDMVDYLTKEIPNARVGLRMLFSARPFPGWKEKLTWLRKDANDEGNWYWSETLQVEGWLCGALFRYFSTAPEEIFVSAEALPSE